MRELFEFLFCPVHGIFSPANWGWAMPMLQHFWSVITIRRKA